MRSALRDTAVALHTPIHDIIGISDCIPMRVYTLICSAAPTDHGTAMSQAQN